MRGKPRRPGGCGTVTVCGEPHVVSPLEEGDVAPGLLVKESGGLRAYRVVHLDGGDAILRNLRHPHLFQVEPLRGMSERYRRLAPLGRDGGRR